MQKYSKFFIFLFLIMLSGCVTVEESVKTKSEKEYFTPAEKLFNEATTYIDTDAQKAVKCFEDSITKMKEFIADAEESSRNREYLQTEIETANSYIGKAYFGIGRWVYYKKAVENREISLGERLQLFEQAIDKMRTAQTYHLDPENLEKILAIEGRAKDEVEATKELLKYRAKYQEMDIREIMRKATMDTSLGKAYIAEYEETLDKLERLRTHAYLERDAEQVIAIARRDMGLLEKGLIDGKVISVEEISSKHFDKGTSLYKQGKYLSALEEFKMVLSDHPSYKEAAAKIREIEDNINSARAQYKKTVAAAEGGNYEEAKKGIGSIDRGYLSVNESEDIEEKLENMEGGGELGVFTHDGVVGTQKIREGSMGVGNDRNYSFAVERFGDMEICVSPGYKVEGEGFILKDVKIFEGDYTRYKRYIREKVENGTKFTVRISRSGGPDTFKFIFKLYPR